MLIRPLDTHVYCLFNKKQNILCEMSTIFFQAITKLDFSEHRTCRSVNIIVNSQPWCWDCFLNDLHCARNKDTNNTCNNDVAFNNHSNIHKEISIVFPQWDRAVIMVGYDKDNYCDYAIRSISGEFVENNIYVAETMGSYSNKNYTDEELNRWMSLTKEQGRSKWWVPSCGKRDWFDMVNLMSGILQ